MLRINCYVVCYLHSSKLTQKCQCASESLLKWGAISAQDAIHLKGPLLPEDQHITPASTCAINPQLSDFKMEKQSASGEENALKGT